MGLCPGAAKGTLAQSDFELILSLIHQDGYANGVQKAVLRFSTAACTDNAYLLDCAARHKGRFSQVVVGMVDERSLPPRRMIWIGSERGVTGLCLIQDSMLIHLLVSKTASETHMGTLAVSSASGDPGT